MKLDVSNLPEDSNLFVKEGDIVLFNGKAYQHSYCVDYSSEVLVRARRYGMTPFEYTGGCEDDVLLIPAYRDLLIPEACPQLPYHEEAKRLMEEAVARQDKRLTEFLDDNGKV